MVEVMMVVAVVRVLVGLLLPAIQSSRECATTGWKPVPLLDPATCCSGVPKQAALYARCCHR